MPSTLEDVLGTLAALTSEGVEGGGGVAIREAVASSGGVDVAVGVMASIVAPFVPRLPTDGGGSTGSSSSSSSSGASSGGGGGGGMPPPAYMESPKTVNAGKAPKPENVPLPEGGFEGDHKEEGDGQKTGEPAQPAAVAAVAAVAAGETGEKKEGDGPAPALPTVAQMEQLQQALRVLDGLATLDRFRPSVANVEGSVLSLVAAVFVSTDAGESLAGEDEAEWKTAAESVGSIAAACIGQLELVGGVGDAQYTARRVLLQFLGRRGRTEGGAGAGALSSAVVARSNAAVLRALQALCRRTPSDGSSGGDQDGSFVADVAVQAATLLRAAAVEQEAGEELAMEVRGVCVVTVELIVVR